MADFAGDVDGGHELHFDFDLAFALAGLAAAALDVKRKPSRFETGHFGVASQAKKGSDMIKGFGVGSGIASGGAADRTLIN